MSEHETSLPLATRLAVCCLDPRQHEKAQAFCLAHGLMLTDRLPALETRVPLLLVYAENDCYLQQTGLKAPGPVRASFVEGAVEHRRQFGGGKGQMIAKAVGLNKGVTPSVLDATAGLGRDAWVLASLGCEVHMLERSPVIAELLHAGLTQARDSTLVDIAMRMCLSCIDAHQFLSQQNGPCADVVYLDPMYPHRDKSAAVKKEMRLFQELIGADSDAHDLVERALAYARHRVVVKRPAKGDTLSGRQPDYQLPGKSCRYDIYTLKRLV